MRRQIVYRRVGGTLEDDLKQAQLKLATLRAQLATIQDELNRPMSAATAQLKETRLFELLGLTEQQENTVRLIQEGIQRAQKAKEMRDRERELEAQRAEAQRREEQKEWERKEAIRQQEAKEFSRQTKEMAEKIWREREEETKRRIDAKLAEQKARREAERSPKDVFLDKWTVLRDARVEAENNYREKLLAEAKNEQEEGWEKFTELPYAALYPRIFGSTKAYLQEVYGLDLKLGNDYKERVWNQLEARNLTAQVKNLFPRWFADQQFDVLEAEGDPLGYCNKFMCQQKIRSRADWNRWVLTNHPDKCFGHDNKAKCEEEFKLALGCYSAIPPRYCTRPPGGREYVVDTRTNRYVPKNADNKKGEGKRTVPFLVRKNSSLFS
jgi:hypothetical protein